MRLVHLSDLHLGYRQYQRLTPLGVNQREADVAATFRAAIDRVISIGPDVIVIAGDVFHAVRPPNQAILHAFLQFTRLVHALPRAQIVMIAGNHDTPRSSEAGGILQLFAQLGMHVVDRDSRRLEFPELGLSILAVPGVPGLVRPDLKPDSKARFNVLLLHGLIRGVIPGAAFTGERAIEEIPLEELGVSRWDYVALGDYHVHTEVAPNAFYSGSIDYTSRNMWRDVWAEEETGKHGKGFIERDLETGRQTFHGLPVARQLVDLRGANARGLTASQLDELIGKIVGAADGGIDDKIVRLVLRDVPRHVARDLDQKAIREYKRRALNFQLDIRRPDVQRSQAAGSPRRPHMLDLKDIITEKLKTRTLDADIDRDALITRALAYIDEAQAKTAAPMALLES